MWLIIHHAMYELGDLAAFEIKTSVNKQNASDPGPTKSDSVARFCKRANDSAHYEIFTIEIQERAAPEGLWPGRLHLRLGAWNLLRLLTT